VVIGTIHIEKRQGSDGTLHVTIAGKIDERFDADAVIAEAHAKVVMHLGGVRSISSLGVRAFEHFVHALKHEVVLIHVSPAVASQIAMIPNLMPPNAHVESAKLPFVCPSCGAEKVHSVPFSAAQLGDHAPACTCGAKMELDGLAEQYLPS
jgi:anti-anti-sigma regulatory factor